jgi:hypothetical protein
MTTNHMSIIPQELQGKFQSPFIKADEFKVEGGVKLKVKGFEVISASDPKYGAEEKSALVTKGVCAVGQTLRYKFETVGEEFPTLKNFDSTSITFFIAFSAVNPKDDDIVNISRTGEGKQTEYTISLAQ